MRTILISLFLLFCFPFMPEAEIVPLKDGDVNGLVISSSHQYTGDDFLQYKGSDAGLYLEYGFKTLVVQEMMLGVRFSMYATLIPDQWGDIFFARITFPQIGDLTRFLKAAGLMEYNVPIAANTIDGNFREYQTTSEPLTILFLQSQQKISIRQVTGGF